jgi:hypothetical protein
MKTRIYTGLSVFFLVLSAVNLMVGAWRVIHDISAPWWRLTAHNTFMMSLWAFTSIAFLISAIAFQKMASISRSKPSGNTLVGHI